MLEKSSIKQDRNTLLQWDFLRLHGLYPKTGLNNLLLDVKLESKTRRAVLHKKIDERKVFPVCKTVDVSKFTPLIRSWIEIITEFGAIDANLAQSITAMKQKTPNLSMLEQLLFMMSLHHVQRVSFRLYCLHNTLGNLKNSRLKAASLHRQFPF